MKKVITYFITFTLAVLMITAALTFPAFAGEAVTEAVTEEISEVATEFVTDTNVGSTEPAEIETSAVTASSEDVQAVQIDEWLYDAIKQANPEQMEMVEKIVMGGVNSLDKLGIKGFDRVRVWIEYNTATVMLIAAITAMAVLILATIMQKKGLAKQSALLHSDAKDFYKAGQAQAEQAQKALKQYADRADEICRTCAEEAKEAAESAKAAQGKVEVEREMLIAELNKSARVNAAMCETVNFLLQCSDLSQAKRDEAEAIYRRGVEALNGYAESPAEEVNADEEHHQA